MAQDEDWLGEMLGSPEGQAAPESPPAQAPLPPPISGTPTPSPVRRKEVGWPVPPPPSQEPPEGISPGMLEAPPPRIKTARCPRCNGSIRAGAALCPNCRHELVEGSADEGSKTVIPVLRKPKLPPSSPPAPLPQAPPAPRLEADERRPSTAPPPMPEEPRAQEPPKRRPREAPTPRIYQAPDEFEPAAKPRRDPFVWVLLGAAAAAFAWVQFRQGGSPPAFTDSAAPRPAAPARAAPAPDRASPAQAITPADVLASRAAMPRIIPDAPPPEAPSATAGAAAEDIGAREWVFSGRLRDFLSLKPVSATLVFDDFRSGKQKTVLSDRRGRFRVRLPVAEGDGYYLKVSQGGYLDRYDLDGADAARLPMERRRERAAVAARSVQRIPLSPPAEGRLELDVLLVPESAE